jgi:hypothetical protein
MKGREPQWVTTTLKIKPAAWTLANGSEISYDGRYTTTRDSVSDPFGRWAKTTVNEGVTPEIFAASIADSMA